MQPPSDNDRDQRRFLQELPRFLDAWLEQIQGTEVPLAEVKRIVEEALSEAESPRTQIRVPMDILEFRRTLVKETDRGCALACTSYLDSELRKLIASHLVNDEKLTANLFDGNGPLSSFSARIDVACGLGLIAANLRRDLHLIRKVRNIFAHQAGQVNFDDKAIAPRCAELYHDLFKESIHPRKKFITVTMGILGAIHGTKSKVRHRRAAANVDLTTREALESAAKLKKTLGTKNPAHA